MHDIGTFTCISSLPSFLADSEIWGGFFSPKAQLDASSNQANTRNYLACHRWNLEPSDNIFAAPTGSRRLVIELALSILERGLWTLPSWEVEQQLAQRATAECGWSIASLPEGTGNLRLKLNTRVPANDLKNVLVLGSLDEGTGLDALVDTLCQLADAQSPCEAVFLREVAKPVMSSSLLCALIPQRAATSMGLDVAVFKDQRVDFALETHNGKKLVIEVDGDPHKTDPKQREADLKRDAALQRNDWTVWRIPTDRFTDHKTLQALQMEFKQQLDACGIKIDTQPQGRDQAITQTIWAATAVARIQALVLESMLSELVPSTGNITVSILEHATTVGKLALADLDSTLTRLAALYGVLEPVRILPSGSGRADLVVDISVIDPRLPTAVSKSALAWSRPACRSIELIARRVGIGPASPRFLPTEPDEAHLDNFVRDLFRKNGFRRDPAGNSDQAAIVKRILMGKDVVGLLPTGAGKSLPYMLAGLLLPGLTLYVGPLKSLLQDQTERLLEAGIGHVKFISSALDQGQKKAVLAAVASTGIRFLLVSPERFLTRAFIEALKNMALWQGNISQVVIDECHCVSEWGHEFRPAYLSLGRIARDRTSRFAANAPLVALTGTASTIVLSDVIRELGITDPAACIRAASLDRSEISIKCTRVNFPDRREKDVEKAVRDFLGANATSTDGALVFCPFKGGRTIGVFSVAAHLIRTLNGIDVRFFAGGESPWKDFAVFRLRRKADELKPADIQEATPVWALDAGNHTRPWEEVKAAVQRNFVSGTVENFRVLVATKAFGMGIDKPSIRKVVHVVAPTSPEAYYQEIGRAGRDRIPSEAELFFCDIESAVTNKLLDPGLSQQEARQVYQEFKQKDPYGGGDFLRTYYFLDKSFNGVDNEIKAIAAVIMVIREHLGRNELPIVPFTMVNDITVYYESSVEHAIVRLIHLGVIDSYFKDYNRSCFEVDIVPAWMEIGGEPVALALYLSQRYENYVRRYQLVVDADVINKIASANASRSAAYTIAATTMVEFIYQHIEKRRRHATRQMLELARTGVANPIDMRERLLNYLQVSLRYTALLEALAPDGVPSTWLQILTEVKSPQELGELHGAAQRVLESYPSHPGLLFLAAISRPLLNANDKSRSEEEISACVSFSSRNKLEKGLIIAAFLEVHKYIETAGVTQLIVEAIGLLHLQGELDFEAAIPFLDIKKVRDRWLALIIQKTLKPMQSTRT